MVSLISKNPYHLMGLDLDSSQKEINKRFREINRYISIDEPIDFESDLYKFNGTRNDENIKEAFNHLTDPKKKINCFFFWFQIVDEKDEQAYKLICNLKYDEAINVWKQETDQQSAKFHAKKNLGLLYCYLLCLESDHCEQYLKASIDLWKSILDSDEFWKSFEKYYKLHDDLDTDISVINQFKTKVKYLLSDIYAEISHKHNDYSYSEEFYKVFHVIGEKMEHNILSPLYQNLNVVIDKLEAMNISEDGIMDDEETKTVKSCLTVLQDELNKTVGLGLFEESSVRVIRDKVANSIKRIALDIHNNLYDRHKSSQLIEIAHKISGTMGMSSNLKENLEIIEKNKVADKVTDEIMLLISEKKYQEALDSIRVKKEQSEFKNGFEIFFNEQEKLVISAWVADKYKEGNDLLNANKDNEARLLFTEIKELISKNLGLFDFNQDWLNKAIDGMKGLVHGLSKYGASEVDKYRNKILDIAEETFKGRFERNILIYLIDSYMYLGLLDYRGQRKKEGIAESVGQWIFYLIIFGIIASCNR